MSFVVKHVEIKIEVIFVFTTPCPTPQYQMMQFWLDRQNLGWAGDLTNASLFTPCSHLLLESPLVR
jgi:hypothetical protein